MVSTKAEKVYRIFSKSKQSFYAGPGKRCVCDITGNGKSRVWKTLESLFSAIEWHWGNISPYNRSKKLLDYSEFDDLELVEYEVVLVEKARRPITDDLIERRRQTEVRKRFGYRIGRMYEKIKRENLEDYRYIVALDKYESHDEARLRLREIGAIHGKDYRYTCPAFVFKDLDNAIFIKLSFADNATDIYDIQTLTDIEINGG